MLPKAFLNRMQGMLGNEYKPFIESFDREKYHALRLNPFKNVKEEDLPFHMTPVSWEKNGYYYEKDDQPGKHPYHEAGLYYIQEPSAMAVVPLMEVRPGEKVLDLCAAPGGKSTQIAARLCGKGLLVSNEIHPARAKILSENIERMGVRNVCVTNENPTHLSEVFPEYFDRILVDAPCSGEGMFRKNEAACEEWSPENVEMCAKRQDEILDCAAKMLRPGGRLVYSTCTFAPAENEGSIGRFLKRHPDFVLLPIDKKKMGLPEGGCDGRGEWTDAPVPDIAYTLRLFPHLVKGEGHFAAVLQKAGEAVQDGEIAGKGSVKAAAIRNTVWRKDKELSAWWKFWQDTAKENALFGMTGGSGADDQWTFLRFGENLYLTPIELPPLKGLKVLRPGLHLGTLKKDRFEPSHALALAFTPEDMRHTCQISAEDPLAAAYLSGQTFPYEGEKGWYLIHVDGYSIGWGKLSGGIMKNHYPKGLRRG